MAKPPCSSLPTQPTRLEMLHLLRLCGDAHLSSAHCLLPLSLFLCLSLSLPSTPCRLAAWCSVSTVVAEEVCEEVCVCSYGSSSPVVTASLMATDRWSVMPASCVMKLNSSMSCRGQQKPHTAEVRDFRLQSMVNVFKNNNRFKVNGLEMEELAVTREKVATALSSSFSHRVTLN